MKTFALALLMATLTWPVAAGQAPDAAAITEVVADYVGRIENEEMSLMVVHLNDFTTDALFSAPTKYSMRAQARQNMLFFVQGVAKRDIAVDTDYRVLQMDQLTQPGKTFRTNAINLSNFEDGALLSEGEEFQGIIWTPATAINLRAPFEVRVGDFSVPFALSREAVERLEQ